MLRLAGAAAALVGLGAVAGCEILPTSSNVQSVVTQNLAGMPAGDFFDRYGRWRTRSELPGGGAAYAWESAVGAAAPGPFGLEEKVCKLRLVTDRAGRIETATVAYDDPGRLTTSRCGEMFKR